MLDQEKLMAVIAKEQKRVKILEAELSDVQDSLAKLKRYLDDVLYNLDDDNLGTVLVSEKRQIKEKNVELQSKIEQTAAHILMKVSKSHSDGSVKIYKNSKAPFHPRDEDLNTVTDWKNRLWKNEHFAEPRYYFWSDILNDWAFTDNTVIESLFRMEAGVIKMNGEVIIDGNLFTKGTIEGSRIYSPLIYGAGEDELEKGNRTEPFVLIDEYGYRLMFPDSHENIQKVGITVDENGIPIMVFEQGDGSGITTINGVTYSNQSFVIQKHKRVTTLGLIGTAAQIALNENGSISLYGKVCVGASEVSGNEIATRSYVDSKIASLIK